MYVHKNVNLKYHMEVIHGKGEAGRYGFPTANIRMDHENEPGIFFGLTDGTPSVIYTSTRDTSLIETHILNTSIDLYGKRVTVDVLCKIRDDCDFDTMDDTLDQIRVDIKIAEVLSTMVRLPHRVALSFSGGKEASILYHCLQLMKVTFDCYHYTSDSDTVGDFVNQHHPIVVHGDMKQSVMSLDTTHDTVFLGVRRDDLKDRPLEYRSTWLTKCEVCCPLYHMDYHTIWRIIDTLGVNVSHLYSEGHTSVGYNSKPNELLRKYSGGYNHARTLKCVDFERK